MEKTKQKQITDFLINNGVIIVMFILVIVAGLTTQNFFTLNNLNNLLNNMSFRLVIALGIAGCVITAGCDLSAGRLIGLDRIWSEHAVYKRNPAWWLYH